MVRQAPKSKKPTKSNPSLVREMSRAYAEIVYNISAEWVRNKNTCTDLFGCCYEQVIEVSGENGVKIFFNVHLKEEKSETKHCSVSILLPKGTKVSEETLKRFNRNVKMINNLLMKDYREQNRLTGHKFYRYIFGRVSPKKLLCWDSPLKRVKDNLWTMRFTPPCVDYDGTEGWGFWQPLHIAGYFHGKSFAYPDKLNSEALSKYRRPPMEFDENDEPIGEEEDEETANWRYLCQQSFEQMVHWKDGGRCDSD